MKHCAFRTSFTLLIEKLSWKGAWVGAGRLCLCSDPQEAIGNLQKINLVLKVLHYADVADKSGIPQQRSRVSSKSFYADHYFYTIQSNILWNFLAHLAKLPLQLKNLYGRGRCTSNHGKFGTVCFRREAHPRRRLLLSSQQKGEVVQNLREKIRIRCWSLIVNVASVCV